MLRSVVGYDEGIKIEAEFLLHPLRAERRPFRNSLDPQDAANPALSFGSQHPGDLRSLTWNDDGRDLNFM